MRNNRLTNVELKYGKTRETNIAQSASLGDIQLVKSLIFINIRLR